MTDRDLDIGRLDGLVALMVSNQKEILTRISAMENELAYQRGARRGAMLVAGGAGALVSPAVGFGIKFIGSILHGNA